MKTHSESAPSTEAAAGSESPDATVKELKTLLAEAEKVLAAGGEEAATAVANLRDRTRAALEKSRASARHVFDLAKERATEADEAIHQHPYVAIGVAAGAGLLLGALIGRCRCR